jgi:hypothetical protein
MSASWLGYYVPEHEGLVVAAGSLEAIVEALSSLAGPLGGPERTPDERGRTVFLYLHAAGADLARRELLGDEAETAVLLSLEQYGEPEPWADDASQRYCAACGALVPTLAVCDQCGTEEEPQLWRLGPNRIAFRRSFALVVHLEGGPSLITLPTHEINARLRRFLGGVVERAEGHIGCNLKLVPVVVA